MCEQSVKLYNYIKLEQPYVYLIFLIFVGQVTRLDREKP